VTSKKVNPANTEQVYKPNSVLRF